MTAIVIVEYDPQWRVLFRDEKERILTAIALWVAQIEHVGSTSVPGLAAKPTIDIMIAVRQLADAAHCIKPLADLGYEYVPEHETVFPERRFFRRGLRGAGTHYLHVVEPTSEFWERHLLFRDYLRAHADEARRYAELKRDLAVRYGEDRAGYTEAKTSFIAAAVAKAVLERGVRRGRGDEG